MNGIPYLKKDRVLVWHDEFRGNKLDSQKWFFSQTMTNADALYDNSEGNIRIENNELLMRVNRLDGDKPYTLSQGLTTHYKMSFKYGYVEMRANVPFRRGAWPSFWMMSVPSLHNEEIGWSASVNIFEVFADKNTFCSNLCKVGESPFFENVKLPSDEDKKGRTYTFENYENLNNEYHVYGLDWTKQHMSFFVVEKCYYTYNIDEENDFGNDVLPGMSGFHEYMFLILNNEIFTKNSPGCPEGAALTDGDKMPIEYRVDWIRLYQNPLTDSIVACKQA